MADKYRLQTHRFRFSVTVKDASGKRHTLSGHALVVQVNAYALVCWDVEGLEGVFFVPVWCGLNEEMHTLLRRHAQQHFTTECAEWELRYGKHE